MLSTSITICLVLTWGAKSQANFPKMPSFPNLPENWGSFSEWRGPVSFTTGSETMNETQRSYKREFSSVSRTEAQVSKTPRIIVEPPIINVSAPMLRHQDGTLTQLSNSTTSLVAGVPYNLNKSTSNLQVTVPQLQTLNFKPSSTPASTSVSYPTSTSAYSDSQIIASKRGVSSLSAPAPIELSLPDISIPQMNLNVGSSRIEVAQPIFRQPKPIVINLDEIEVPAKKILVRAPKVNIGAPQVQLEKPNIITEPVEIPKLKINVSSPTVRLSAPKVEFSEPKITGPTNLDLPPAKINIPAPRINIPSPKITYAEPELTVSAQDVNVPASQINVAGLQFNYQGPEIDIPEPQVTFEGQKQSTK